MTPSAIVHLNHNQPSWPLKSSSAALHTNKSTILMPTNDDKLFHNVRPTNTIHLNGLNGVPKPFLFKSLNYPPHANDSVTNVFRRPKAANLLRDISIHNGHS